MRRASEYWHLHATLFLFMSGIIRMHVPEQRPQRLEIIMRALGCRWQATPLSKQD